MHALTQFLSQALSANPESLGGWNMILALLAAYFGGVLSSLTPCVYPMIPITVGVVGGIGTEKKSWHVIFTRGIAYIGGMTVIYSFLGVLAGLTGKVFGTLTNNSAWYLSLGILMSFASLIMLDIIPFDPLAWGERIKSAFRRNRSHPCAAPPSSTLQKDMTLLGAFALGASSGFIAAPCTTPVLTSILAYIATSRSVGLGFALMLSFSLGLGTLLLIIAVFAGALQVLPRSGQWMKTVKTASGLILLAFAEYLIYRAGNFGGP